MSMRRVFAALAGRVRRMTAGMRREKPSVTIEDYVLEHFLLYNGLVGSTPDNQPQFKDVRNDIVQAINDGSSHQLSIVLKALPPLWWEDRLEKIFAEIRQLNNDGVVKCLLAQYPDGDNDMACLTHSNWQARSNAARMVAFLDLKQAVLPLVALLEQCNEDSQRAGFCHIAYSLARLGTEPARVALTKELGNAEPWFCVDAAGALASWPLNEVCVDLMDALLSGNELDDYMAVAITKHHKLIEIAGHTDEGTHDGAAELVLSLLKAVKGAFHSEASLYSQLEEAQDRINELACLSPTPRRLAAAIALNSWIDDRSEELTENLNPAFIRDVNAEAHVDAIKNNLENPQLDSAKGIGQFKHALALAGQFRLQQMAPLLVPLISKDSPVSAELMLCLASLGEVAAAEPIARVVKESVDLDERCAISFEPHPVLEQDKKSSDLYYAALIALGSLPHQKSLEILWQAVRDFAPDKREQALLSLQTVLLSDTLTFEFKRNDLENLIRERCSDPAVGVQVAALTGVAQHKMAPLISDVIKSLQSRENAVFRRASETLISLANNGYKNEVKQSLEAALSKEHDSTSKQRFSKVLANL